MHHHCYGHFRYRLTVDIYLDYGFCGLFIFFSRISHAKILGVILLALLSLFFLFPILIAQREICVDISSRLAIIVIFGFCIEQLVVNAIFIFFGELCCECYESQGNQCLYSSIWGNGSSIVELNLNIHLSCKNFASITFFVGIQCMGHYEHINASTSTPISNATRSN